MTEYLYETDYDRKISIHTPTKGVTSKSANLIQPHSFQSTLPRREWPPSCLYGFVFINFNPHSHEGSDHRFRLNKALYTIFQSTLPRREWQCRNSKRVVCFVYFNPHSHEGSDEIGSEAWYTTTQISIHTPTKGVTTLVNNGAERENFNPHSHEGSDYRFHLNKVLYTIFQSTLPRREWRSQN